MTESAPFLHIHSVAYALLLLPLLAAVIIGLCRRQPTVLVASAQAHRAAGAAGLISWAALPRLLEAAGVALLVVGLMRPQYGVEKTIERQRGVDIILALDISTSMLGYDVPDGTSQHAARRLAQAGKLRTRLDIAKDEMRRFSACSHSRGSPTRCARQRLTMAS
jgi:hypothetical protein